MDSPAVLVLGFMYFMPSVVGAIRKVPNLGSVMVINLFLGWSLIGWVVAMAMAARSVPSATSQTIIIQNALAVGGGMEAALPHAERPSLQRPPAPLLNPAAKQASPVDELRAINGF